MNILDRYLSRAVITGTLLVLFVLVALSAFFNLLGEADNIGQGNYTLWHALQFVLLGMPQQAYEMFPVAVLLGALLGLGQLANGNELVVMRTAGISVVRLGLSVLYGGIVLAALCIAAGEMLAPPAERYAQRMKTVQLHQRVGITSAQGIWVRDDDTFVNIRTMTEAGELERIYAYSFEGQRLKSALWAARASFGADGWQLQNAARTVFTDGTAQSSRLKHAPWRLSLQRDLLDLFVVDSDTLSTLDLYRYIDYLHGNGLDARFYETAFWSRIVTPISVLVMTALALPFVFGSLRAVGAGQRIVMGMLIGVAYTAVSQVLQHSGQVFGLPPLLTTWGPVLLLALLTFAALRRVN